MHGFDRRQFLAATSAAFAALAAAGCRTQVGRSGGYGALRADPAGLLDLPDGFAYRIVSQLGETMADGVRVPDAADGMGCFELPGGKLALVRNHELRLGQDSGGASSPAYDNAPGGTTTLILNARTLELERQFRSLNGTTRNCAGGITPWGSWLSCEEDVTRAGSRASKDHGWVFEVPASATGPVDPVPLKAMGRFNHEAAAVDPATGMVYLTEDREDGLLYRFVPNTSGRLAEGGKLQALALFDSTLVDSRNWVEPAWQRGDWLRLRWIDLDNPESPQDDLRRRGARGGAVRFARGEGIHMGNGEVFFICTSGGAAKLGQIFRLRLGSEEAIQLFYESNDAAELNYGDNLTIAPDGQLVVCEDQYSNPVDNHLRGITRDGQSYALARLRTQTELAGACFSPDGRVLFVNVYSPTKTLAITGPWAHLPRL